MKRRLHDLQDSRPRRVPVMPLSLVVSLVAWSAVADAQVVAPTELVGTWVSLMNTFWPPWTGDSLPRARLIEDVLTFRADRTWTAHRRVNGVEAGGWPPEAPSLRRDEPPSGHWYVAGDTLWFSNPAALEATEESHHLARRVSRRVGWAYQLRRQNAQLALGRFVPGDCPERFQRVTAVPSATLPHPMTPPSIDVLGTWVAVKPDWGNSTAVDSALIGRDTLTFRLEGTDPPDSTWTHRRGDTGALETGFWVLFPGNLLRMPLSGNPSRGPFYEVARQGAQLVLHPTGGSPCTDSAVYRRVGP